MPGRPLFLCVDDDQMIRRALARILQHIGADVLTASNGREALEVLRNARPLPTAIFTDLEMPVLDGEGLIRALRQDPTFAAIPVVVVSATWPELVPDLHVPKPFGMADVLRAARTFWPAAPDH
jgi:CheY-like chemotaxis protein